MLVARPSPPLLGLGLLGLLLLLLLAAKTGRDGNHRNGTWDPADRSRDRTCRGGRRDRGTVGVRPEGRGGRPRTLARCAGRGVESRAGARRTFATRAGNSFTFRAAKRRSSNGMACADGGKQGWTARGGGEGRAGQGSGRGSSAVEGILTDGTWVAAGRRCGRKACCASRSSQDGGDGGQGDGGLGGFVGVRCTVLSRPQLYHDDQATDKDQDMGMDARRMAMGMDMDRDRDQGRIEAF